MTPYRQELRALARLATPIFISQFSMSAYGFIDTLMAGQVSALDLAAVAVGSSIWLPLYLLTTGTLLATSALIAEAGGANEQARIPVITQQALWLAVIIGGIGFGLIRAAYPIFDWMGVEPALRAKTHDFLEGVSWGMPALGFFYVLRCYCEAQNKPLPVMLISILGLAFAIAANQLFIYGSADLSGWHFIAIPAMGGPGCGWATSLVLWLQCFILLGYVLIAPSFAHVRLFKRWIPAKLSEMATLLRLGLPIGLAVFFEVSSFALVAVLVSPHGATVVAGHQVALSVTSILFMLPLSLSLALTIRTGQAYGARNLSAIQMTRQVGLLTTVLVACCTATFLLVARHRIASVYSNDAAVCALAAHLLLFAVAYQIVDALQVAAAGCLRGLQDTRSPMLLTLFAYWAVAIPFGYIAGSTTLLGQAWGPSGYWAGLVLGLSIACILLNWQLRKRIRRLALQW